MTGTMEQKGSIGTAEGARHNRQVRPNQPAEMFFGIALILTTLVAAYGVLSLVVNLLAAH